jgi:phospho-N-acetylmuramoyl-pentapeptide-transferase
MFYYLAEFRELFSGLNIFRYITFRAGMATVTTFLFCIILGPYFIKKLKQMKIREIAKRADCPDLDKFQHSKEGTPTMGGIFIIISILMSVILWADLSNLNIILTMLSCVWLAVLGFMDDYTKLSRRNGKRGLSKRVKLFWEVLLGVVIGVILFILPDHGTMLYFPFLKSMVWDLGVFYILLVTVVIIGTSNAVNLTDGLDGLAIGCVLIVSITLAALSYVVGNIKFSEYLFLPYIAGAGELTIFCAAIVGASLGFLWFNCHPATVFMGDVGSLALGGTLGTIAVLIKKELWLVIVGGVFVMEALSVILQVFSFRVFGKRILKMSPFHHHLQLSGWNESKIIIRLWIVAIIFALLTLTTLKLR